MTKVESVSLLVLKTKIILLEIFYVTLLCKSKNFYIFWRVTYSSNFLLSSADVEFCGYSVPHPSETKIMLRIQCREKPAIEALRTGLDELKRVCDVIMDKFTGTIANAEHEINMNKEI